VRALRWVCAQGLRWLCAPAPAIGLALRAGATPALAAGPAPAPAPLLAGARLQGFYVVSGIVTTAVGVPGEHRGDHVRRIWALQPPAACPTGPCETVALIRRRAAGTDKLLLRRRRAAFYSGVGAFLAPVRCGGRLYRKGELVTFTITLQITAVAVQGTDVQATGFVAHYRNRGRLGLTRCVSPPSYDSASYLGSALPPGAIRSVASTRSSTAS